MRDKLRWFLWKWLVQMEEEKELTKIGVRERNVLGFDSVLYSCIFAYI